MKSFSKLVKSAEKLHEFNFRRLAVNNRCHVDVPDGRGNRIIFEMQKEDGEWKIHDQLPDWIMNAERELSTAIEENVATA